MDQGTILHWSLGVVLDFSLLLTSHMSKSYLASKNVQSGQESDHRRCELLLFCPSPGTTSYSKTLSFPAGTPTCSYPPQSLLHTAASIVLKTHTAHPLSSPVAIILRIKLKLPHHGLQGFCLTLQPHHPSFCPTLNMVLPLRRACLIQPSCLLALGHLHLHCPQVKTFGAPPFQHS